MEPNDKNIQKIRDYLGISDELARQFAKQINQLHKIESLFTSEGLFYVDKDAEIERHLKNATKALEYEKHPYRIVFAGGSGVGKTALVNSLLGRALLPSEAVRAVTGTAIQVFFIADLQQESVRINLRQEQDIFALVEKLKEIFKMNQELPKNLNPTFAQQLRQWQPNASDEAENRRFVNLRDTLANIVDCFVKYRIQTQENDKWLNFLIPQEPVRGHFKLQETFLESFDFSDITSSFLKSLVNEGDKLNQQDKQARPIDLVSSLTYRLKLPVSQPESPKKFHLPPNVCLVDLPGLTEESELHNLIFTQGVTDANVVVITLTPNRLPPKDSSLYRLIFNSDLLISEGDSPKSVFLVLNKWDEFSGNDNDTKKLQEALDGIYKQLSINRDYRIFAKYALLAQLLSRKEFVDGADEKAYKDQCYSLGIQEDNYEGMLEKAGILELVNDIMAFVRDYLVRNELEKGRKSLNLICDTLNSRYRPIISYDAGAVEDALNLVNKCRKDVEKILRDFRREQLRNIDPILRPKLQQEVANKSGTGVCDRIDKHLLEDDKLPKFWRQCYNETFDEAVIEAIYEEESSFRKKRFLSLVQLEIWKELPKYMALLANVLVNEYRQAIESKKIKQIVANRIASLNPAIDGKESIKDFDNTITEMGEKLTELSRYVAHLQMFDDDITFLPQGKIDQKLEEAVIKLPRQQDLPSPQFKNFVSVVRSRYMPAIHDWSVSMLLGFYQYQMVYIETSFRDSLQEFFLKVRGRVQTEESLRQEILLIDRHPEQQMRESLTAKREVLNKLCEDLNIP